MAMRWARCLVSEMERKKGTWKVRCLGRKRDEDYGMESELEPPRERK